MHLRAAIFNCTFFNKYDGSEERKKVEDKEGHGANYSFCQSL